MREGAAQHCASDPQSTDRRFGYDQNTIHCWACAIRDALWRTRQFITDKGSTRELRAPMTDQ